jgi:alpha-1,3-rhamnosyl/mannosyltransferase
MLTRAVKKACRIITVSEKTKDDLLKHLGAEPDKIKVIYPAISPEFKQASPDACRATLTRYGLKPGFILFVGDVRPHKNMTGLLAAHRLIRRQRADCPPVVVVGKTERVPGVLLKEEPAVRWLGALPKEELIRLYSSAGVLAFPTLYEGFGLPPLEAMACGCPVVASPAGGLPESVGDAGLTVDPHQPASIAEGITKTLWEAPLRERLIQKGLARSKIFSWEKAARETWKVYDEALA